MFHPAGPVRKTLLSSRFGNLSEAVAALCAADGKLARHLAGVDPASGHFVALCAALWPERPASDIDAAELRKEHGDENCQSPLQCSLVRDLRLRLLSPWVRGTASGRFALLSRGHERRLAIA